MNTICKNLLLVSVLLNIILLPTVRSFTNKTPYYGELYRPGYHFSPIKNWMNDANGLIYQDGVYHLSYQYNLHGIHPETMSWGHATSRDLVYWEHQPVAIPEYKDVSIWSGSIIPDQNNTSGLCDSSLSGKRCLLAFYCAQTSKGVAIAIAYSNDYGYTFTQYKNNPIISSGQDPRVLWYEPGKKWILLVALSPERKIKFYSSANLINWTFLSIFGPESSPFAANFDCPDFFPINVENEKEQKWVLITSGNSFGQYFVGDFNGTHFVNSNSKDIVLMIDYGNDFYAAYSFNNVPNDRRLMIAWLDSWEYADAVPTEIWRGQQSIIRELHLVRYPEGLQLFQKPADELNKLRYMPVHYDKLQLNESQNSIILGIYGKQIEINIIFVYSDNQTSNMPSEFGIKVFVGKDQETVIGYDVKSQSLFVDRTRSGVTSFSPKFSRRMTQVMTPEDGTIKLRLLVDQSSVEVFGNSGKVTISSLIYPNPEQDQVIAYAIGGTITASSIDAWLLKSIWPTLGSSEKLKTKEFLQF